MVPSAPSPESTPDAAAPSPDGGILDAGPVLEFLTAGGPVLYILAALSIVTAALVIAKALQFAVARLGSRGENGALGRVSQSVKTAVDRAGSDRRFAEDAGLRAARGEMRTLETGLGMLGMIAMLSPLIGLLGTVIGMIDAFQVLEEANNSVDPSLLSGGIWVALLTTAAGLIVAIPATIAHGWFEGRLRKFADEAECLIGEETGTAFLPAAASFRVAAE